ncbi:hypothetical protein L1987_13356 [Smallanthus sonchifolius]|uniref:Uncharacterized protein n=1 Tax=Smallanthus sonchifolius TaxID=185202 RepID=A0ACB9JH80_9ASTR|nr:hypothetical protein L1987_13356 [Smallanthus sonchifolius]
MVLEYVERKWFFEGADLSDLKHCSNGDCSGHHLPTGGMVGGGRAERGGSEMSGPATEPEVSTFRYSCSSGLGDDNSEAASPGGGARVPTRDIVTRLS